MARFLQIAVQDEAAIRKELIAGLTAATPSVSPKFFYDLLGSRLFEAICELPEYYPTRTEADIFATAGESIARACGVGSVLIDLGAGNCAKAAQLFPALQPRQYVPIDISVTFMHDAVEKLQQQFPAIDMLAIGNDFSGSLALPDSVEQRQRLFFYPGSSIGNFAPDEARAFLRRLRAACDSDGGVLIGIDLVKEKRLLDDAYDDALGVTASFNLNVLNQVNRLLGADFNPRQWQHRGFFNPALSRIEMHLEARTELAVQWDGGQRRFASGERIHTENSYKYTRESFTTLLNEAGFKDVQCWTDDRGWFLVCHGRAG